MSNLKARQELAIEGTSWQVVQHPGAPGMAYGQEGRAAVVYQLCRVDHSYSEKVSLLGTNGQVFEVPADGTTVTLGRAPGNQIVLTQVAVSRQHGALVVKDGQLMFWDNSARNGTFIDGKKVEPLQWVPVPAGSRLQLGTAEDGEPLAIRPSPGACRALKVFKSRFRVPRLVELSARLASYSDIPGLRVCTRTVFTPQDHRSLLVDEPELIYGILMPWVEGRSWMEVILERQAMTAEDSLRCATSLVQILVEMEQRAIAHCDLSGPNLSLESVRGQLHVQLVDVEQLYAPGLDRPEEVFAGSPGYAHRNLGAFAWSPQSDRFAGAILVCELLAWCSEKMREAAWSESFFDPSEMQTDGMRSEQMRKYLQEFWGEKVARLFERAWRSDSLEQCPTFGEWQIALPERMLNPQHTPSGQLDPLPPVKPVSQVTVETPRPAGLDPLPPPRVPAETVAANQGSGDGAAALADHARQLEEAGDLAGSLKNYRLAQSIAVAGSAMAKEIALIVTELESRALQPTAEVEPLQAPPAGLETTKKNVADAELLQRVRALEGAPGLAPIEKRAVPAPPKNRMQLFGYALIAVMSALFLAFLIQYQPWKH